MRPLSISLAVFAIALAAALSGDPAPAEVAATDDAIVSFNSRVFPKVLPRNGTAPVGIVIEGRVRPRKNREPASLEQIELSIHKAAKLFRAPIPQCHVARIHPASTKRAMAACGRSRIGWGRVRAETSLPGRERLVFDGRVSLFNGRLADGRAAILMHVFNAQPPSSYVFAFKITKRNRGDYRTVLTADTGIGRWSRITAFRLVVSKTFRHKGRQRGYFNASCPAPKGLRGGISPVVKARLSFKQGSSTVISVLGSCRVSS